MRVVSPNGGGTALRPVPHHRSDSIRLRMGNGDGRVKSSVESSVESSDEGSIFHSNHRYIIPITDKRLTEIGASRSREKASANFVHFIFKKSFLEQIDEYGTATNRRKSNKKDKKDKKTKRRGIRIERNEESLDSLPNVRPALPNARPVPSNARPAPRVGRMLESMSRKEQLARATLAILARFSRLRSRG